MIRFCHRYLCLAPMMAYPSTSAAAREDWEGGTCVLTYEPLDVDAIMRSVRDDNAGATAVFIGTTRNSFKGITTRYRLWTSSLTCHVNNPTGKVVTRLEYQAYSKLAIKTMVQILRDARKAISRSTHQPPLHNIPSLISCTAHHRLGTVPVGEPSIVIAVSSPHRKEAFAACERILEDVKDKAQIWKREYYEGMREEEAEWKANNC